MIMAPLFGEFAGTLQGQFWPLPVTMGKFGFGKPITWTTGNV